MPFNTRDTCLDLSPIGDSQLFNMATQAADAGMSIESWALWLLVNHADEIVNDPSLRSASGLNSFPPVQ